jgi:pimeloyl-ACP methyl ester carboxylesterase
VFGLPFPIKEFKASLHGQVATIVYMDVPEVGKQKGAVVLFHGKNFSSDYWAPTIAGLIAAGYRVIAPDQIGFGKSSKPDVVYHFDDLAQNTQALLKSLGINKTSLIANSWVA